MRQSDEAAFGIPLHSAEDKLNPVDAERRTGNDDQPSRARHADPDRDGCGPGQGNAVPAPAHLGVTQLGIDQSPNANTTAWTSVVVMSDRDSHPVYQPLSVLRLGVLMTGADDSDRWRLVAEFLEDYRWESTATRSALLEEEPAPTGDDQWDVFLAALAEYVAARDGRAASPWTERRSLRRFWFPFNTRAGRVDALVHAPAAFRRRGIYVSPQELSVT